MFNKKQTIQSDIRQQEIFNMLIQIFTPEAQIYDVPNKTGKQTDKQTCLGIYTVTSKPSRQECVVKEGRSAIFEIYQDNDYSISTRGMYLKHLQLNNGLLEKIASSLVYNPRFDMKHSFVLKKEDVVEILSSFKNRDASINNGLVKPGEIENSSKK